jgi:hypothetical protein
VPLQLALIEAGPRPHRQPDTVGDQVTEHAVNGALAVELIEDQPDDGLGLLVGVERYLPGGMLDVAGRRRHHQLASAGLVQLALVHPALEDVQLGLAHHPRQPEQQPIRILVGVVQHVGIRKQHAEAGAQLEQLVPVLAGARQPAHLQAEDQPDVVEGGLGQQPLEARAALDRLAALAQVVVGDLDLAARPAQQDGPVAEGVLTGGGLLMLGHLLGGGLADVDDGCPVQAPGLEPGRGGRLKRGGGHDAPPAAAPSGS